MFMRCGYEARGLLFNFLAGFRAFPVWFVVSVVCCQCGLLSVWFVVCVVCCQCGLLSVWFLFYLTGRLCGLVFM